MGAVPVLIMLAAVGVDYGWQPDGTTSPRGDNVQYIIQISPHQLDQIRSVGEITSTIDPAIQGRVSQIVVQIGTGPLPRDAGRALSSTDSAPASVTQAVALAEDAAQLPIPELADDPQARKPRPSGAAKFAGRSGSEALMKPDPQGGGLTLPEGLQTPVRTNPEVSTDPRQDSWDDISGRAAAPRSQSVAGAAPGATPPSTDPVEPATRAQAGEAPDSYSQLQSRQSPTSAANAAGNAPARTPATAPFSAAPFSAAPSNAGSEPLQMPPTAAVGSSGNRPTDPSDPNWSGYGTTRNFGTLPPGLTTTDITRPPSGAQDAATTGGGSATDTARAAAAPQQQAAANAQTTAANENFRRDAAGNLLDRLGRMVDGQGRLIDPQTRQLVDAAGNLIDEYGQLIDRLGRPLPATTNTPTGNAQLQAPLVPSQPAGSTGYSQPGGYASGPATNYNQPGFGPPAQQPGYAPSAPGQDYSPPRTAGPSSPAGYPSTPGYSQGGQPQLPAYTVAQGGPPQPTSPPNYSSAAPAGNYQAPPTTAPAPNDAWPSAANDRTRPRRSYDEDDFVSPSDGRRDPPARAGAGSAASDHDLTAPLSSPTTPRPRTVAAQPFFNFVLLISLVGNAYLIYETGNLRRKFRNMIASVRATKLAAQPANS